jgi:hypothetical protein
MSEKHNHLFMPMRAIRPVRKAYDLVQVAARTSQSGGMEMSRIEGVETIRNEIRGLASIRPRETAHLYNA